MATPTSTTTSSGTIPALLVLAWLWVGIPLAWGVILTIINSVALFK